MCACVPATQEDFQTSVQVMQRELFNKMCEVAEAGGGKKSPRKSQRIDCRAKELSPPPDDPAPTSEKNLIVEPRAIIFPRHA